MVSNEGDSSSRREKKREKRPLDTTKTLEKENMSQNGEKKKEVKSRASRSRVRSGQTGIVQLFLSNFQTGRSSCTVADDDQDDGRRRRMKNDDPLTLVRVESASRL